MAVFSRVIKGSRLIEGMSPSTCGFQGCFMHQHSSSKHISREQFGGFQQPVFRAGKYSFHFPLTRMQVMLAPPMVYISQQIGLRTTLHYGKKEHKMVVEKLAFSALQIILQFGYVSLCIFIDFFGMYLKVELSD